MASLFKFIIDYIFSDLCIRRFIGLKMAIIKKANIVQKIKIPVKVTFSPTASAFTPILAANMFPIPDAAKNKPIIKAAYLSGANFVIRESETGEAHNSPIV